MLSINPLKYYLCLDNRQTACKAINRSLLHFMDIVLFCSEHKLTIFMAYIMYILCTYVEGYFYVYRIIVQNKLPIKWHIKMEQRWRVYLDHRWYQYSTSHVICNVKKLLHGTPEKCDLSKQQAMTQWPLTHCLSSPAGAVRGPGPGAAFRSPTCV